MGKNSSKFELTKEDLHQLVDNHSREQEPLKLPPYDGIRGILKKLNISDIDQGLNENNKQGLKKIFWSRTDYNRKATVIRNGKIKEISNTELLVGDIS